MKKILYAVFLLLYAALARAQNITGAEYFFNTDPGRGSGTALTISGTEVTKTFTITPPTGMTGFNNLYIRPKNADGTWGFYSRSPVYIYSLTNTQEEVKPLGGAEYFFNTDPGLGNGTAVTMTGTSDTKTYTIPLPTGMIGFNNLYIRSKNTDSKYAFYERVPFYVYTPPPPQGDLKPITAAEFFIDDDPGLGSGTALTASGSDVNKTYVLPLPEDLRGFHQLYIRMKNQDNVWTFYEKVTFFIYELADLTISPLSTGEFFYDTDPGIGNGKVVSITPTAGTDKYLVDLSTVNIPCGIHDFYLRIKNENGTFSLYQLAKAVDVYDNAPPTILAKNHTIYLNASGSASFTWADIDLGTYDDCELASVTLSKTSFNCGNLGANTVTITATDALGKISTKTVTITVSDAINPVAVAKNITVNLNASGSATITPAMIDNGSTDNCAVTERTLSKTTFGCSNTGANTVTLTVRDAAGNTSTATATVTVVDNIAPTALAKNITVNLNATGEATIIPAMVDNASTDNCAITERTLSKTTFNCGNIGANTVTLTVRDAAGNTSTATSTVTIADNLAPVALTKNISVNLNASGSATITPEMVNNGSTDNCGITVMTLSKTSFSCSDVGDNTVTLTLKDAAGNTSTATAAVSVVDNIAPNALAKNITVNLTASGTATITAAMVDNGSTDNCTITERSLSQSSFACSDVGENTVTLTITDASGNTSTATAVVTVVDNLAPVAIGKDITVHLGTGSTVTVPAQDVDDGSTDNCGIVEYQLSQDTFTETGVYPVTFTVSDASGNTDSVTVNITVETTLQTGNSSGAKQKLEVYPVPVKDNLYFRYSGKIIKVKIYDAAGRLITEKVNPKEYLNLSPLVSGAYLLIFETEDHEVIQKKIIKN